MLHQFGPGLHERGANRGGAAASRYRRVRCCTRKQRIPVHVHQILPVRHAAFPRVRRRHTREPHGCLDAGVQAEGLPILRTAFVDAVSTLPSRQNQGYGSATMQRLAEKIGDYEIGCLQTDRTSFYAHLGWEEWRGLLAGRSDDGLIPTPDQRGVMVLRLPNTPPLDLDAALTIERQGERIWE